MTIQEACAFLGVDVPREEFPRTNDTAAMRQRIAAAAGAAAATG